MRKVPSFLLLHVRTSYLAPFAEKTVLFPLNCFGALVGNQLTVNVRIHFWTLNTIPLIYVYPYANTTVLITVAFDIGTVGPPTLLFFLNTVLVIYGHLIYMNFKISFSISAKK